MLLWIVGVLLIGVGLMAGIERLLRALHVERDQPNEAPLGLRDAIARLVDAAERRAGRRSTRRD